MRGDEFFAKVAGQPPFNKLHPQVAAFFKGYLSHEKVVRFRDHHVVNTQFPPFPSPAFDNLVDGFLHFGDAERRRLYSVTLAVTNRCEFNCWHCYNAGRSLVDLPLATLHRLADELQSLGAVMITLTGGEPLLRADLEDIARRFDERSCVIVGTTGAGLTAERAGRLRDAGVFGVGVSLDADDEREHDCLRGRVGAFRIAMNALQTARDTGLYPYIVAVATHEFLEPNHFTRFMRLAGESGALEVHLLEPSATGRLAGRDDVLLSGPERQRIFDYQAQDAADNTLPILSAYAYVESADAFGCGAGLTHLYIDGSGEVCPCQLVPLSFGSIASESLSDTLTRMGHYFLRPRGSCVGRVLAPHVGDRPLPTSPSTSAAICKRCLPERHVLPRFFQTQSAATAEVGTHELRAAYDRVHDEYDEFWLTQAARPIHDLIDRLAWRGDERVFEAGCGTGYATALLAARAGSVVAVDLSAGMLAHARRRLGADARDKVRFVHGDALAALASEGEFDVVFTSWVLGYIPRQPFFDAAIGSLRHGGRLAFVVHKENSPREPLEIFGAVVARDPAVLTMRVAFDFPPDTKRLEHEMAAAGLTPEHIWEGIVEFRYDSPQAVLDHLLKSGAGTAFYDAIVPERRAELTDEFVRELAARHTGAAEFVVGHEYIACIACKG